MLDNDKAIVLFSGGQDSTTCLYWAKKRFKKIYAISFDYGQKHSNEVNIAQNIAQEADVEFIVLDAHYISKLSVNSLTNTELEMDETNDLPNTFVPGRNLFSSVWQLYLLMSIKLSISLREFHKLILVDIPTADITSFYQLIPL